MILLAFLLPLALYLVALGFLNRRAHPLVVPGTWDFIGVLFGASGFLFFGGPAILGSLEERWRMFWLVGEPPGAGEPPWPLWVILSGGYFLLVVVGAALLLWRRRSFTAIYNVTPAMVEHSLEEVCAGLGLSPVRSGNVFLFGIHVAKEADPPAAHKEGIQAPHYLPQPTWSPRRAAAAASDLAGQEAVLEIDSFPAMNHATLRWGPTSSPVRQTVERALADELARYPAPDSDLGGWLLLVGFTVLGFVVTGGATLLVLRAIFR